MFNLSETDAQILLAACTGLTALVVAWLRTVDWPEWVKFFVAVLFSGVAGALTAYVGGTLSADATLLTNLAVVYTAGRLFYFAAFQALGLERILLPKVALATEARAQTDEAVSSFSTEQAKAIVSTSDPATLDIQANVVTR